MPKGNFGALKELKPITTDLGDIPRGQEKVEAQKRREKQAQSRFDINRQDKTNDKIDANSAKFIPNYTNFKHVDDAQTDFSEKNAQIYAQLETEIAADPMRKNPETIRRIARRDRILQTPQMLANITKYWKDYSQDFIKGIGEGKYSKTENKEIYDLFATMLDADFEFVLDDKDQIGMYIKGADGEPEFIPAAELYSGGSLPRPKLAFNESDYKTKFQSFKGKQKEITTDNNFNKITKDVLSEESIAGRKNLLDTTIGADAENPTSLALDIWRNKLGGDADNYDHEQVKKYLEGLGGTGNTEDSKVKQFSAENSRMNLNQRKKEFEYDKTQDAKDNDENKNKNSINLMTDTLTGKPLKVPTSAGLNWAKGESFAYSVGLKNVKIGTELVDIDELYVNEDGRVAFKGTTKKDVTPEANITNPNPKKKIKTTEVKGNYFNDKKLNKVADAMGLKNSHALMLKLDEELKAHNSQNKEKKSEDRLNKLPE